MKSASRPPEPRPEGRDEATPATQRRTEADLRADPQFQARLEKDTDQERLRTGRVACLLVILLMPLGTFLERSGYPDKVAEFLLLRLACSVLAGGLLALHYTTFGQRRVRWLGPPIAVLPAFFMEVMIARTDGFSSPYYAGITLVLLAVSVVVHWSLQESLTTTLLILAGYTAAGISAWSRAPTPVGITFSNFYFLVLTGLIVVTGNALYNRLHFREFASRYELDVSRRLLEESYLQLRELDAMKGRFFANISHELRTPLTLLIAPIERLREHPACRANPAVQEYLGTMHDNGMRLLKLINDLLDLVRLDAGGMVLHRTDINVESFMKGLVNAIRRFAEDRGLRLSCDLDPALATIHADPDKLEKALLNLLFNSVKFTPAGGQIVVQARREGEVAVLAVRDTGVGIAPENVSKLFRRFWQADTSSQRKHQGAGLGLALVKELIEAHGGSVQAHSKLGEGTMMTVCLPVGSTTAVAAAVAAASPAAASAPPPQPAPEAAPSESGEEHPSWLTALYRRAELFASVTSLRDSLRPWNPPRQGGRPRLLLADDEPDMRRFLRSQLEDDYQVIEAVDGAQAAALTAQYLPDVLVCDMMMPEKDGLQVCREVRASHSTRSLPILLLTARADEETKLHGLAAGASDFLPKPFSTAELRLRLKNLVDSHRLQKELTRQNQKLQATLEQLQETELQLVQAEKLGSLGRMSAGIIHEINNPLNFVKTGLCMLARQAEHLPETARADYQEILRDMQEGVDRVVVIVSDLRAFTHLQGGQPEDVDVRSAADAALRFLSAEWKSTVQVQNEIPSGFTVKAIRTRLVQVFVNLMQNSLDALRTKSRDGEAPTLRLDARTRAGARVVTVWDNGPGIPAQHLSKVFDPFFTTKEVGQGTGLGLSICYRLLSELGGRISVNSEEGRFCEFTLEFPDDLREDGRTTPTETETAL